MADGTYTDVERAARGPYRDQIDRAFTYQPPVTAGQRNALQNIRTEAHRLALLISNVCPQSRETSAALTKVEEAVMWANAAVVRHPP